MKQSPKIYFIFLLLLISLAPSCVKEEQYPVEPAITFLDFGVYRDVSDKDSVGVITISYTDGDGDIGLNDWDTLEPYKYNYYLKFLEQVNGTLTEVEPADKNINFNARIPILTPEGRNKNIKGNIAMSIELYYSRYALKSDTVAFEIYIKDRALHSSNVIQTPLFILKI